MSDTLVYVYAIARGTGPLDLPGDITAVDGGNDLRTVGAGGLTAFCSEVPAAEFSQEALDKTASDIDWLGSVGFRHQEIVSWLAEDRTLIPLRAFTLFHSEDAVAAYLESESERLFAILSRLDGKDEWSVRIELDPPVWERALESRSDALRELADQARTSGGGKAYLLRKKLDDERARVAQEEEELLVQQIDREISGRLQSETMVESRKGRGRPFAQINILMAREKAADLEHLHRELDERYRDEGASLVLTGPWPPYTFVAGEST
ncbi:MAG TPA: GvpL/GvpF family gas vesicle protein [Thermoanaerobaculia bacterium]|nr:GvpL/GvpF family gas vesicle protein [Thermoanaerobaculia bacterium]